MPSRRAFLIGAGATALFASGAGVRAQAAAFSAGAGRADVVFSDDLFPLDDFVGQHDSLTARVVLLNDGTTRIGIAIVDMTSIAEDMIAAMKVILSKVAGVRPDNAIVAASHTFSAPHVADTGKVPGGTDTARNDAVRRAFEAALTAAAKDAVASLQPARLGFGSGISRVSVNRDVETLHGWWLGADDAGFTDPALGVLRIDGLGGKPLAIFMNYAVQSSIMDGSERAAGGRLITGDLAGAAARHVEAHYGAGAVALFLVGAAGDQAPYLQANRYIVRDDGSVERIDIHEDGFALVDLLGERLGGEAVRVAQRIETAQTPLTELRRESVTVTGLAFSPRNAPVGPVTSFAYQTTGPVEVPVVLMRLGDIAFVGVQPELSAGAGAWMREHSPFPHTIVATMVDGAAKYMPDAASYDRFTYEARNSPYAKGAAEAAASAIVALLDAMKSEKK